MIATTRFVFLHLHKSGGTFVNQWLLRFFPEARQIGYHLPRKLIPAELSGLPVIGVVRNPWSYYVSWYAFQSRKARPNALFRTLSEQGNLGFEGTIRNMLELGSSGSHLNVLIDALPRTYGSRGINLPGPELALIRGTGLGFYSFLYDYIYAGEGLLHLARMENLRDEVPTLIRAAGGSFSEEATQYFANAPATNRSAHELYPEYYSDSLRDLVADRDRPVIERYGYRFGR
jgi:hypothetical protein